MNALCFNRVCVADKYAGNTKLVGTESKRASEGESDRQTHHVLDQLNERTNQVSSRSCHLTDDGSGASMTSNTYLPRNA